MARKSTAMEKPRKVKLRISISTCQLFQRDDLPLRSQLVVLKALSLTDLSIPDSSFFAYINVNSRVYLLKSRDILVLMTQFISQSGKKQATLSR